MSSKPEINKGVKAKAEYEGHAHSKKCYSHYCEINRIFRIPRIFIKIIT